ncbi:MAG: sigma 54-interacting transcriptional regulator, partial [Halieaceae bacterium]|nr:sigma 54-interacting transcriptional regulator [Halieaceae bacterium]
EPGSSRLRSGGEDVTGNRELSQRELARGVALALGEHVLLHLRRVEGSAAELAQEPGLPSLVGVGAVMAALRSQVAAAAGSGDDVLLIGPTGTGKELLARAIHELGPRRAGPWVPVNMAAIPTDLAAASLFGARRGAFTGADAHRRGYFSAAQGGTLFLDEVGDTPPPVQPQLLRALQEREVQVLGGETERVELTVVSAMERDPDDPAPGFRRALRHRLGVQELRLPALAERAEDIGPLVLHFINRRGSALPLPADACEQPRWLRLVELLLTYPWPGNVRELEHAVAQLAAASRGGRLVVPPALLDRLRATAAPDPGNGQADAGPGAGVAESPLAASAPRRLCDLDEAAFEAAWEEAGYEPAAVARLLGVSRPAVYRRLKSTRRCRLATDVPPGELAAALDACHGDLIATARRLAVSRRGLEARLRTTGLRQASRDARTGGREAIEQG